LVETQDLEFQDLEQVVQAVQVQVLVAPAVLVDRTLLAQSE
jgi:hypothetical protein